MKRRIEIWMIAAIGLGFIELANFIYHRLQWLHISEAIAVVGVATVGITCLGWLSSFVRKRLSEQRNLPF